LVDLDTGRTWRLNQVGADVCGTLGRPFSLAELVQELRKKYDVESEILSRDLDGLLAELTREGLVEAVSGSSG
jgi:hypothetical protein